MAVHFNSTECVGRNRDIFDGEQQAISTRKYPPGIVTLGVHTRHDFGMFVYLLCTQMQLPFGHVFKLFIMIAPDGPTCALPEYVPKPTVTRAKQQDHTWVGHIMEAIDNEECKSYEDIRKGIQKHQYVTIDKDEQVANAIVESTLKLLFQTGFIKSPDFPIVKTGLFPTIGQDGQLHRPLMTGPGAAAAAAASVGTAVAVKK